MHLSFLHDFSRLNNSCLFIAEYYVIAWMYKRFLKKNQSPYTYKIVRHITGIPYFFNLKYADALFVGNTGLYGSASMPLV